MGCGKSEHTPNGNPGQETRSGNPETKGSGAGNPELKTFRAKEPEREKRGGLSGRRSR